MIKQAETHSTNANLNFSKSIVAILRSVVFAYIFLIICFAFLALANTYSSMPESSLESWVNVLSALSLIVGGFCASKGASTLGYLHGALSGLICSAIRVILGIAVFGSHISDRGIVPTLLLGAFIAALGGVAGVNTAGRKKKKKRR